MLPVAEAKKKFMRVVKNTPIDSWSYISLSDLVLFTLSVSKPHSVAILCLCRDFSEASLKGK